MVWWWSFADEEELASLEQLEKMRKLLRKKSQIPPEKMCVRDKHTHRFQFNHMGKRVEWEQTDEDVTIYFHIGSNIKKSQVKSNIKQKYLEVSVDGGDTWCCKTSLGGSVKPDESLWCIDDTNDVLWFSLQKLITGTNKKWRRCFKTNGYLDPTKPL